MKSWVVNDVNYLDVNDAVSAVLKSAQIDSAARADVYEELIQLEPGNGIDFFGDVFVQCIEK